MVMTNTNARPPKVPISIVKIMILVESMNLRMVQTYGRI